MLDLILEKNAPSTFKEHGISSFALELHQTIEQETLLPYLQADLGIDHHRFRTTVEMIAEDPLVQQYAQMMKDSKASDPSMILYHNYEKHILPAVAHGVNFMISEGFTDDELLATSRALIMHDYIMGPDGEYKTACFMLDQIGHARHISSVDIRDPRVMASLAIAPTKVKFEKKGPLQPVMTPYAGFDDAVLKPALLEEFARNGITFEDGLFDQENFWKSFRRYTGVLSAADFNKVNMCQLYPEALGLAMKDSLLISAEFGEYTRGVQKVEMTSRGTAMQLAIQQPLYDDIASRMDTAAAAQVLAGIDPQLVSIFNQMMSLAGESMRHIAPPGQEDRWARNARAHFAAVEFTNQLRVLQSLLDTTGYFLSKPLKNEEVLEGNKKRLAELVVAYESALNKTS